MKIKITCSEICLERMIPNYLFQTGIEFVINNPSCLICDAWFIFDSYGLEDDNCAICPPEKIFFVMGECEQIHIYKRKFIRQFYNLITAQQIDYKVQNIYKDYYACWFAGLKFSKKGLEKRYSYDDFSKMNPVKKTKLMSVITSNKTMCEGHKERLNFVKEIKDHFGDEIDVFGRGICDFEDKWDVLAPYKYHIAIENQQQNYYITEKFHDPYLAFCYPLYYGAPNVDSFYSKESFLSIDIHNVKQSIEQIEVILQNDPYDNLLPDIIKTRDKILNDNNMFVKMAKLAAAVQAGDACMNIIKHESEYGIRLRIKNALHLR